MPLLKKRNAFNYVFSLGSIHFVFIVSNFCNRTKIPLNDTKLNILKSN